jgi:hypothetical protein
MRMRTALAPALLALLLMAAAPMETNQLVDGPRLTFR